VVGEKISRGRLRMRTAFRAERESYGEGTFSIADLRDILQLLRSAVAGAKGVQISQLLQCITPPMREVINTACVGYSSVY
jgi:hypothetical protein